MGKITGVIGSKDEALQDFAPAAAIWEGLHSERPGEAEYQQELAETLVCMASIQCRDLGKPQESLSNLQRARSLYDGLVHVSQDNLDCQAGLAGTYSELGHWYYLNKRGEDEARELQKAYDIWTHLSVADPRYRLDAAGVAITLGFWYTRQARTDEALRYHGEAKKLLEALNREQPGDLALQGTLRRVYTNIGYAYHISRRYDDALRNYEFGIGICERLARENPRVVSFQEMWAGSYNQRALLLRRMKHYDRAIESCRRAISIAEDALANLAPDSFQIRMLIPECLMVIGEKFLRIRPLGRGVGRFLPGDRATRDAPARSSGEHRVSGLPWPVPFWLRPPPGDIWQARPGAQVVPGIN